MRRIRNSVSLLASICYTSLALAGSKTPFDVVPDDTGLAICIGNLDKLTATVAAFGKAIGVDDIAEFKPGELLEGPAGHADGIATDAPVLFVMRRAGDTPSMVAILRLADAAAWKTAAEPSAVEGQQDILKFSPHGDESFAAIVDDVLIVSEEEESVKAALKSKGDFKEKYKKHIEPALARNELAIYIDVAAWRKTIEDGLGHFETMMQMGVAMSGGAQTETGITAVKAMLGGVRAAILDASAMTAGVSIGAGGVRLTDTCSFGPESEAGKYLKKLKKSGKDVLRGIPDAPFAFAFGCEWLTPESTPTLGEKMMKLVAESIAADTPQRKELEQSLAATAGLGKLVTGHNGAWGGLPEGKGGLFVGSYLTSKPADAIKFVRDSMKNASSLMNVFSFGIKADFEHNSERIADTDVDAYSFKFAGDDPQAAAIMAVYGEEATTIFAPRKEDLVYVMGPREAGRARMAELLGGTCKPLSGNKRVVEAAKGLSPSPDALLLLDLGEFVRFAVSAAGASGMPVPPIHIKSDDIPFIAGAAYLDGESVKAELVVPAATIERIVSTVKSMSAPEPK